MVAGFTWPGAAKGDILERKDALVGIAEDLGEMSANLRNVSWTRQKT